MNESEDLKQAMKDMIRETEGAADRQTLRLLRTYELLQEYGVPTPRETPDRWPR